MSTKEKEEFDNLEFHNLNADDINSYVSYDTSEEDAYEFHNGKHIADPEQNHYFKKLILLKPEYYAWTDLGLKNLLADVLIDTIIYVNESEQYFCYDGIKWIVDSANQMIKDKIEILIQQLEKLYPSESKMKPELQEKFAEFIHEYNKSTKRNALISDMTNNLGRSKDIFDRDPYLINCQNGTYNLKTGKLQDHNPNDLITKVTRCDYASDDKKGFKIKHDPRFFQFFDEITSGDKEKAAYLKEALGYTLLGLNPKEIMFIAYGKTTRNGKSTLLNTISSILGDYAVNKTARFLNESSSKNDTEKASPSTMTLIGKRFINLAESGTGAHLDSSLIKTLTGNDDIEARGLYNSCRSFKLDGKMWFTCNTLPYIDDRSIFASDRVAVITFDKHFEETEREEDLKQRFLENEDTKSQIFKWLCQGYLDFEINNLARPNCIIDATYEFELSCNTIERYLNEKTISDRKERISKTSLREDYMLWCNDNEIKPLKKQAFKTEILNFGYEYLRSNGKDYYLGLKLRDHK